MGKLIYRCKQHFSITIEETAEMAITALVAGLLLAFNDWGSGDQVNIAQGISNTILNTLFVLIGLTAHVSAQKVFGLKMGYKVKYRFWKLGLVFGAMFTFITAGVIPLFFPGHVRAKAVESMRVGKFGPRWRKWEVGLVNFAGSLAGLILVLLAKPIFMNTQAPAVMTFIEANLWLAIWSLLPVPLFHGVKPGEGGRVEYKYGGGTPGFSLFAGSRPLWVFFFSTFIVYSLLVLWSNTFSLPLSILVALVILAIYYFNLEAE